MTKQTFEDFLEEKHMEECPTVLDDDLPDAFNGWVSELDGEQMIAYGDEYGELRNRQGFVDGANRQAKIIGQAHEELMKTVRNY